MRGVCLCREFAANNIRGAFAQPAWFSSIPMERKSAVGLANYPNSDRTFNGLMFDCSYRPTGRIGIGRHETRDGKSFYAGLTITGRLPYARVR